MGFRKHLVITDECCACFSCVNVCPKDAIVEGIWDEETGGPIYENHMIKESLCNLCAKKYDEPQCIEVCPIEGAIIWVDDI